MAKVKHRIERADAGTFHTWEYHEAVDFVINGRTIKVDEWRKEFLDGIAIIRIGYMRIDNSPRFQIIILFRNIRVMADRPPFRNFDDALEAADAWLADRANKTQPKPKKLTAIPQPVKILQIPPPANPPVKRQNADAPPDPSTDEARNEDMIKRLKAQPIDDVIREEYYKLDHGKASIQKLCQAVSDRVGYLVTLSMIQNRTGAKGLHLREDKKAALIIARPIVKARMKRIIKENPDFGFGKCYKVLEETDLAGYRKKWVETIYHEARKESGVSAKGNHWLLNKNA